MANHNAISEIDIPRFLADWVTGWLCLPSVCAAICWESWVLGLVYAMHVATPSKFRIPQALGKQTHSGSDFSNRVTKLPSNRVLATWQIIKSALGAVRMHRKSNFKDVYTNAHICLWLFPAIAAASHLSIILSSELSAVWPPRALPNCNGQRH